MQKIVLSSGGIDSTALIDFYLRRREKIKCIHFQYGQLNAKSEKTAFDKIVDYFKVESDVIHLNFEIKKRGDEVIGRNAIFVIIASSLVTESTGISIGIHTGSCYYDSTDLFINDVQRILDGYFLGSVRIEAPFLSLTKKEIFEYCKKYDVPIHLTYSCVRKNAPPCGKCNSCLDRIELMGESNCEH